MMVNGKQATPAQSACFCGFAIVVFGGAITYFVFWVWALDTFSESEIQVSSFLPCLYALTHLSIYLSICVRFLSLAHLPLRPRDALRQVVFCAHLCSLLFFSSCS
jgi:hypothetical protein